MKTEFENRETTISIQTAKTTKFFEENVGEKIDALVIQRKIK
jgi:hypothetical protein